MNHETTGFSPFQLVFGREPLQPMDSVLGYNQFETNDITGDYALNVKSFLENARELAIEKINSRHQNDAPRFNERRSELTFKEGDLVLEKRPVGEAGLTTKLLSPWIGPLRVLQQTSPVNYRVIPVNGRRLPYIVHVERLKRFISREETEESKRLPSLASTIEADAAVETLPFVFNENKGPVALSVHSG